MVLAAAADQIGNWTVLQRALHRGIVCYARRYQGSHWDASTVPASGAAIIACNHLSVLDPLLLIASNQRLISFLVAQEYYDLRWLRPWLDLSACIPVRRDGRDLRALLQARRLLQNGRVLGIFPEGGIARGGMEKGLAWLVRESAAPVVPARILGVRQYSSDWQTWLRRQHPVLRYGVPLHFHPDADAGEILGATRSAITTLA
ncbi:lysophospholipid acyltransferase family protein [Acidithiobacillus sp. AMEEHan]|uniref:lysophospholipid acyltransferase family protein n=1 Tax=Acidithiobacillus sp. AMEEHan TaxID=2994951 RepID=UPI0027E51C99|nr:lysophospholipid acyltransferase family protein [Acidithiobacillus sp. AMEEHan]